MENNLITYKLSFYLRCLLSQNALRVDCKSVSVKRFGDFKKIQKLFFLFIIYSRFGLLFLMKFTKVLKDFLLFFSINFNK